MKSKKPTGPVILDKGKEIPFTAGNLMSLIKRREEHGRRILKLPWEAVGCSTIVDCDGDHVAICDTSRIRDAILKAMNKT